MRCEKCGKRMDEILVRHFDRDGSDFLREELFTERENCIEIEVPHSWTGYDLTEEEQSETIECPFCGKFPFKSKEVQSYEVIKVICLKEDKDDDEI